MVNRQAVHRLQHLLAVPPLPLLQHLFMLVADLQVVTQHQPQVLAALVPHLLSLLLQQRIDPQAFRAQRPAGRLQLHLYLRLPADLLQLHPLPYQLPGPAQLLLAILVQLHSLLGT